MIFAEILMNSLSILTICGMLIIAWQKRNNTGSMELIILSLFMLEWAICSFMEQAVTGFDAKLIWRNVTQLGVFYTTPAVLVFSIAYTGIFQKYQRKIAWGVYLIQTGSILFILTDWWHHLARTDIYLDNDTLVVVTSIWDKLLISFNFVYMAISVVIIIVFAFLTVQNMRKQVICVAVGMLIIVSYSLIKVSTNGLFGIEIPISGCFAVGEAFMFLGVLRFDLTMISPIARNEAINIMNDGIIIISASGRIVDANPAARHIFNLWNEPEAGQDINDYLERIIKNSFPQWYDVLWNRKNQYLELTSSSFKDVYYYHCESYDVKNKRNKVIGSFSVIKDITEQKRNNDQLILAAEIDGLTGIYNRVTFIHKVETLINEMNSKGSLLFLDVDFFKQINDRYGHAAGDFILTELCNYISAKLPEDAFFGRMGGEEFAIFTTMDNLQEILKFAESIRFGVEHSQYFYNNTIIKMTISIGVATGSYKDFNKLYNIADANLYKAKRSGRNCIIQ